MYNKFSLDNNVKNNQKSFFFTLIVNPMNNIYSSNNQNHFFLTFVFYFYYLHLWREKLKFHFLLPCFTIKSMSVGDNVLYFINLPKIKELIYILASLHLVNQQLMCFFFFSFLCIFRG